MTYAVGIDLGTTFTAAARADDDGPRMVGLAHDRVSIPSVVAPTSDRLLVGEETSIVSATSPWDVAKEFKRRFGDTTPMLIAGHELAPEDLTGALLRWVVDRVEEIEGESADQVVVTHPAAWGPYKRDLLKAAAADQGLQDITLLPEPAAAAIHYQARHRVSDGDTIAVYDMGGGTFDVSLLERRGGEYSIRATGGLDRAGGLDLDDVVFGLVSDTISNAFDELDTEDPEAQRAVARLREECTRAKIGLSYDTRVIVPVVLPGLVTEVLVQRAEFEALISPLIDRTIEATEQAIARANLDASPSGILLVGGSSRVPIITQRLTQAFGVEVVVDTHPKHAVALGAATSARAPRHVTQANPTHEELPEKQEVPETTVMIDPTSIAEELNRPIVIVLTGPHGGKVIELSPGPTTLGRDDATDVHGLGNRLVSRRHLELNRQAGVVTASDLGSTNGTRVDGELLGTEPRVIEPGTIVDLAGTLILLDGPAARLESVGSLVESWALPSAPAGSLGSRLRRRSTSTEWLLQLEELDPVLHDTVDRVRRARTFQRPSAAVMRAWRRHLPERFAGQNLNSGTVMIGWADQQSLLDFDIPDSVGNRAEQRANELLANARLDPLVPLVIPLFGGTTVIRHRGGEAAAMIRSIVADLAMSSPEVSVEPRPEDGQDTADLRIALRSSPATWDAGLTTGRLVVDSEARDLPDITAEVIVTSDGTILRSGGSELPFVPATLSDDAEGQR